MLIINGALLVSAIRQVWNFQKCHMMTNFSEHKPSCPFYKWGESKIYRCWVTSPNPQTEDGNKKKSHHWQRPCYQIFYKTRACLTKQSKNQKETSPKSCPSTWTCPTYLNHWFLKFSAKITLRAEENKFVSQK